jgi:hypothetical protein
MDESALSNKYRPPVTSLRSFESFFDVIGTEIKAYWLGFIMADGCVLWSEKSSNYGLQVVLQSRDIDHVAMLERDLGGSRWPEIIPRTKSAKLVWYSKYLAQRLIELGVCPRKSYVEDLPAPKFPENLARHFWRGLFDGDGSLTTQVLGPQFGLNFRVSLAGSRVILEEFQKWAQVEAGVRYQKIVRAKNSRGESGTFVVYLGGNRQVAALTTALYQNCSRRLQRKYDVHLALLEQNARIWPSYSPRYLPRR